MKADLLKPEQSTLDSMYLIAFPSVTSSTVIFTVSFYVGKRFIYKELLQLNISKITLKTLDEVFLYISFGDMFFLISNTDIV